MASGSSASPMLFFGTIGTADNMELMTNSQQDLTTMLPNSWFSAQHNHLVAPKQQGPDAQVVIEVSPTTLVDTHRFVCEVCTKGFARQQNLTLHRRTHSLPFTLKTNKSDEPAPKKVYPCPEPTCTHHNVSHALGDFGGLKKHYLRKHSTDKKYKCDVCTKAYSVETDLKSHLKVCGKKKYGCVCGARFTRSQNLAVHQHMCVVYKNNDAAKHSQTVLHLGDYNNSSSIISSTNTSDMRDKSVMITSNETNTTLMYPQVSSMLTCSFNSYPSMVNFPCMGNVAPPLFSQSSTQQFNQFEFEENSDIELYADLLMDRIRLEHFFSGNNNYMGDGGDIYGMSSLSLTSALHNTSLNGMMNNPVGGNGVQSSTINPDVGAGYETSYYGYGDGSGFGYGSGFSYGSGMEVFDYETYGAGAGAGAPVVQDMNQHGFWF